MIPSKKSHIKIAYTQQILFTFCIYFFVFFQQQKIQKIIMCKNKKIEKSERLNPNTFIFDEHVYPYKHKSKTLHNNRLCRASLRTICILVEPAM